MSLIKILVVEDSATDRLIITNMLKDFTVFSAHDGLEALQALETHRDMDLMILDLNMPNMNGFEVLERLKSDSTLTTVTTIILTNHDELENEIKGLKLGAIDYIRKPIHVKSLRARIDVHVALLNTRRRLERQLQNQEVTFDAVFDQAPIGIAIAFSKEGISPVLNDLLSINPELERITGRTENELMATGWAAITHPDDVQEDLANYAEFQNGKIDGYEMDKRFIKPDGSIVWVHMIVSKLVLVDTNRLNHIALFTDTTESKRIESRLIESERSKSVLLSHLPGMAYRCKYDRDWTMEFVSEGCRKLTGYASESLVNDRDLSFNDLMAPEYRERNWLDVHRALEQRKSLYLEYEITAADGERKWVVELGQGIFDATGVVEAIEGIIIDVSEKKAFENSLKYNSEHDRWTGLFNRAYLENLLTGTKESMVNGKQALVSLNLSALQSLTISYGFHYSQDVLKRVAQELSKLCTDRCMLFNTFENRFVFYVSGYADQPELMLFCNLVKDSLESMLLGERIGGGIGVLEIDWSKYQNTDQLLKQLLITSEFAAEPNDRKFHICLYGSEFEQKVFRAKTIERDLAHIIDHPDDGSLYLHFQPIIDLKTRSVRAFEALSRLRSPELGLIPPLEFIPIAEKTKFIIPLGEIIISRSFQFLQLLYRHGYHNVMVSINISVIQLLDQDFLAMFLDMMRNMQVSPQNVGIEVTESEFVMNYDEINKVLSQLRDAGIHISMDDFGTGYSSLAREKELDIHCLKIDKFFIDRLVTTNPLKSMTAFIVSMAHQFDQCVVAEGVEHESQMEALIECGCDFAQGYLFSKPLDDIHALEFIGTFPV
ncbi:MAG: EAL domain-containing protein [Sphaerochaeta sp.]|nr:EAL domain-containing protein [Sphaerochaeta sp.]